MYRRARFVIDAPWIDESSVRAEVRGRRIELRAGISPGAQGERSRGPAAIEGYLWSHELPFEPSGKRIRLRILRGFAEITAAR